MITPRLQTVSHLVSTWPNPELDVHQVLPSEDLSRCQQLTTPFDTAQPGGMSLLDSFMVGLLNLKPHSKLRDINFTGFKHGRSPCGCVCRWSGGVGWGGERGGEGVEAGVLRWWWLF